MKVLIDDFYEVVLALEDVSGTVCWPVREWCISWILGSVCASVPRYLWSQCCVCSVAFLVLLYFLLDTTFSVLQDLKAIKINELEVTYINIWSACESERALPHRTIVRRVITYRARLFGDFTGFLDERRSAARVSR